MGKIKILDEYIANKIAAGEVVERPASIVKELVENSIDAGSTKIDINIKEAGLSYIKIKDNGEGLDDEDIDKAFLRHSTSKIKNEKDLFRINTLGFRGEALASIVAVSQLTLKSSTNSEGHGIEVYYEGSILIDKKDIAYVKGTEIIVENLFYNTPARLKYLKSIQTELGHIIDYINRLALANPNISFRLINNGRQLIKTSGNSNLVHVISAVYGTNVAKKMISIYHENPDYSLTGHISRPELNRSNKSQVNIFINNRYIKNFQLGQAVKRGYDTLLMVNRYPIVVLNIEMDVSLLDVNVHPAKLEAKFSKEQELLKFIEKAIKDTLKKELFILEPYEASKDIIRNEDTHQTTFDMKIDYNENASKKEKYGYEKKLNLDNNISTNIIKENKGTTKELSVIENEKLPFLEPIAQFHGTYIIAQSENGLYLIDQHAAHERINYEKNLKKIENEKLEVHEMLVPLTIDYTKSEIEKISCIEDRLKEYGIEIELFGQHTIMVRTVPTWLINGDEKFNVENIIEKLLKNKNISDIEFRKDLVASISCMSSLKGNKYINKKEMGFLIEQLRKTDNPFSCPHGRPIIICFSEYDIEKMFKRVT